MFLQFPLALILLPLLLFYANTVGRILDDFSLRYFNNFGDLRFGVGKVQLNVTYPRHGVYIPGNDDYLIESIAFVDQYYGAKDKSLKIEYTAFSSGYRTISFGYPNDPSDLLSVPFNKGHHQVIVIPFSYFPIADLNMGKAIGFGGPLYVHQIELIKASESDATNIIPQLNLEFKGVLPQQVPDASCLRRPESPPPHQFLEYMHCVTHIPFANRNSLGARRGGIGISKAMNGIHIQHNGLLFENFANGCYRINLHSRSLQLELSTGQPARILLRLQLSTRQPALIRIRIQYHESTTSSTYELDVPECNDNPMDVVLSENSSIPDQDVERIWISGPITVHRISIVEQLSSSRIINSSQDLYPPKPKRARISQPQHRPRILLVDDLANWPDDKGLTWMVINYPLYSIDFVNELFDFNSNQPGSGLNALNYPCFGRGVSIADGGIQLSNHGFIYEQLALRNHVFDLSNARLEIEYSTEFAITRKLQILSVVPNDTGKKYSIQPVDINLNLAQGNRNTLVTNVGECGPSFAFSVSGHGTVTLHHIRLHRPIAGQLVLIVDDFMDWPLRDADLPITVSKLPTYGSNVDTQSMSMNEFFDWPLHHSDSIVTDHTMSISNSIETTISGFGNSGRKLAIFDYRHIRMDQKPILCDATYVPGRGVGITFNGFLTQPLFNVRGLYIIMTYSTTLVVIPIPTYDSDYASSIGMNIHGPLTVHQIEFVDQVEPLYFLSLGDTLLIDDFTSWVVYPPRRDHELYTPGPSGFGSVTLHSHHQYLIEGFTGQWLRIELWTSLFIQITYTTESSSTCLVAVFPEEIDPQVDHDPYKSISVHYERIEFSPGKGSQLAISLDDLTDEITSYHDVLSGLIIHGPFETGGGPVHPLTIHRIELIAYPPYGTRIGLIPEFSPFHMTGKCDPVQDQVGLPYGMDVNDFVYKLKTLRVNLDRIKHPTTLTLTVERGHMWRDTCKIIKKRPIDLMMNKLVIKFKGENGQDDGGLSKEFFTLVSNAIKDPDYALFTVTSETDYALHINPDSVVHKDIHLDQFRIIGRIIGMSILSNNLMDIRLVPSLYRKMIVADLSTVNTELPDLLDEPVPDISELEKIDEEIFQRLSWLLHTDISKMSNNLALTMSLEWSHFDDVITIDLVKNGRNIQVTQSNKNQYVKEYANWHIIGKVESQANALRDGVWDVVPQRYLAPFDVTELDMLISGTSTINVDDWETNTSYINLYSSDNVYSHQSPTIKNFWACIKGWNAEDLAKLLVFVTGSPNLPIAGFKDLNPLFTIVPIDETIFYPRSSTCANTLILPPYKEERVLCERLAVAILPETGDFIYA